MSRVYNFVRERVALKPHTTSPGCFSPALIDLFSIKLFRIDDVCLSPEIWKSETQSRKELSTHAILFGDVSAFADKVLRCWFLRRDCENVSTPLKCNK